MSSIPSRVRDVFEEFSGEFAETVWPRVQVLIFAALLCLGRHTVCRLLRVAGTLAEGHWSSFHRVLSRRRWSSWGLARILARHVLEWFVPRGVVSLSGDDTVTRHPGQKVHGPARHRDAVALLAADRAAARHSRPTGPRCGSVVRGSPRTPGSGDDPRRVRADGAARRACSDCTRW